VRTQTAGLLLGNPTVALFLKFFRPAGIFLRILLLLVLILLSYLLLFFLGVWAVQEFEKNSVHTFFSCINVTDMLYRIDSHIT